MGIPVRPVAIYLPQFHPIPENDAAWGKGFTEWTNVRKTQPLFEGHYQPHVPHPSVGYYDLSNPKVLVRQAEMAKKYGIYGFAFYHYWFNGKRLLEKPVDNLLKTGNPDFPFCLIWANENWTKKWDGLDDEIILEQKYSTDDDIAHITFLCQNVFPDNRYIRINGKPVFIVYRTELLPNPEATAKRWRSEARKFGFSDLYLILVEGFENSVNPPEIDFDAALEFAPDRHNIGLQLKIKGAGKNCILRDYETTVHRIASKTPGHKTFRCVFPSWDNTPRLGDKGVIFINDSPFYFEFSLRQAIRFSVENLNEDEQYIFINSWNEWGEGCHIEPDQKNNDAFLKIIKHYSENDFPTEEYLKNFDRYFNQLGINYFQAAVKLQKLDEHSRLLNRIQTLRRPLIKFLYLFK